jgi:hypothetical protein
VTDEPDHTLVSVLPNGEVITSPLVRTRRSITNDMLRQAETHRDEVRRSLRYYGLATISLDNVRSIPRGI